MLLINDKPPRQKSGADNRTIPADFAYELPFIEALVKQVLDLERSRRAPATINRVLATLKSFAQWAYELPGGYFSEYTAHVGRYARKTDEERAAEIEGLS